MNALSRRRLRRLPIGGRVRLVGLLGSLALLGSLTGTALAIVPGNDLPGGATAITAIPAIIDQDTTEATVTPADDIGCGAGGLDQATVWYTLTLTDTTLVLVDASASDYAVGVNAYAGAAAPENLFACVEGGVSFEAVAGTTYFLMFADIDANATNGGQLHVSIDVAPPPIEISLAVDPVGKVNPQTGEAAITGTISCSTSAAFSEIQVNLRQAIGRFTVQGFGFASSPCEPSPTAWWVSVNADNGKFSPGRATVSVFAFACDSSSCDDESLSSSVRLRR
jgi:hypothetical protein